MYRYLAKQFSTPAQLFLVHPLQLSRWLEAAWADAKDVPVIGSSKPNEQFGSTGVIADFDLPKVLLDGQLAPGIVTRDPGSYDQPGRNTKPLLWDHLIYAYLIESTGVYEIIAQILARIVRGETFGRLRPETLQWVRVMEELLFRDPPPFAINGVVSRVRPDIRIVWRNLYWRMFGLDLPHPLPESAAGTGGALPPWKADVGNGANTAFAERWRELLGQVWTGYENKVNQVGANATDAQYVGLLCEAIDDMLGNRRQSGLLLREELSCVSTMSLCHLTVEYDTPLVQDLQATATSPAERLAKLGERVGMAPAPRSRELFELAEPMSSLLWGIELGLFNPGAGPESLYLPTTPNGPPSTLNIEVNRIIDLWQSATGTRIKTPAVPAGVPSGVRPPAQPLRAPTPGPSPAGAAMTLASSNGYRG